MKWEPHLNSQGYAVRSLQSAVSSACLPDFIADNAESFFGNTYQDMN